MRQLQPGEISPETNTMVQAHVGAKSNLLRIRVGLLIRILNQPIDIMHRLHKRFLLEMIVFGVISLAQYPHGIGNEVRKRCTQQEELRHARVEHCSEFRALLEYFREAEEASG